MHGEKGEPMKPFWKMSWRVWLVIYVLGLFLVIVSSLPRPADAAPRPLCGPTYRWDCTLRNGKHKLVNGTVCDIQTYERKKHATCVRASSEAHPQVSGGPRQTAE